MSRHIALIVIGKEEGVCYEVSTKQGFVNFMIEKKREKFVYVKNNYKITNPDGNYYRLTILWKQSE